MSEYKIDARVDHWPIYIDGNMVRNDLIACRLERQDQEIEWLNVVIKDLKEPSLSRTEGYEKDKKAMFIGISIGLAELSVFWILIYRGVI